MYQEILFAILRTTFSFILLVSIAKAIGVKAISQLTFFNFATSVAFGSVAANVAIGEKHTLTTTTTVLITFGILTIITAYYHMNSYNIRKLVTPKPTVLIENGKIRDDNLRGMRMTLGELLSLLREKNYFNVSDIEYAIIEDTGKLSVLAKSQKQPITPSDLRIPTLYKGLMKDIIYDGHIIVDNLKASNLDISWLQTQLTNYGIDDVTKVFYAGLDTAGGLYVSVKNH